MFSLVVGAGLLVLALDNLEPRKVFQALAEFHPGKISLLLAVALVVHFISTLRWRSFMLFAGQHLSLSKSFWYYLAGYAISFVTPIAQLGGGPMKAVLVHKFEKVPLRSSMVSAFLEVFLEVAVDLALVALALPFLLIHLSLSRRAEWTFGLGVIVVAALVAFLYYEFHNGRGILLRALHAFKLHRFLPKHTHGQTLQESEALFTTYFSKSNQGGLKGFLWTLAIQLGRFVEVGVLFWLLGLPIDVLLIFAARIFMNLAYLVPVPGALGVSEWTQGLLFSTAFGLSSGLGVAFSLIQKAKDFLFALVGLGFVALQFVRRYFQTFNADHHLKNIHGSR